MKRVCLVVAPFVIALAALAPWRRSAGPAATGLVIVTLDTTRADCLPAYGSRAVETPALDSLAATGVVFDSATTVAPLTLPAHATLMTGLYPVHHGARENDQSLAAGATTLASVLRGDGFRTAASVGSMILLADRGIGRGFDTYRDDMGRSSEGLRARRPGNEVVDDAIGWLNTVTSERFFLWVHLYDAHQPYQLPEPFASRYSGEPYLAEIAFADAQIGRLLRAVDARGLARRTAVIVAADHGEALGDHGEEAHGLFVYDSVVHVPLIVHAPGVGARRVADRVSLVDVMPTALDLLGLPPRALDGVSLRGALTGGQLAARTLYAESMYPLRFGWSALRSARDARFKFIDAPRPELYDTDADPAERRNLVDVRPAVARALAATLAVAPASAAESPLDDAARARLASLGYISGSSSTQSPRPPAAPDPKDHVDDYNEKMRRSACHPACEEQQ